ncbi:MAG TPA: RNase adapter RapZ [Ruminococcaceae bacterium]|mgnify:CR=1 FL=1|nr:RNase adapter RapZ [Oscillospiraceae bacterium]HCA30140.1 RNase adapter RapZ [Oscillospiraceae bacterium]
MEFIIVTGLSGAGKSRVVTALEDIGYYCVDNMPPKLLPKFAELCIQSEENLSRVAIVVDVRGGQTFGALFDALTSIRQMGSNYKILFLDCDDQVLARRYKETRRQHPLVSAGINNVQDAIAAERELLKTLFDRADYLINTSFLSPSQLKERITELFLGSATQAMMVQCLSFGFKYGYPSEADLVFDVRCFPNPFYEPELKNKTGLDKDVRDFVMETDEVRGFKKRLYEFMDYMLPLYRNEGKSQLVIAIGCTGGKHRSVALAEALRCHISQAGYRTMVNHRDIGKI